MPPWRLVRAGGHERRQVELRRFYGWGPGLDGTLSLGGDQQVGSPDDLSERARAHRGQQLAHLLGDSQEKVDNVLGLACEAPAQVFALRRDAGGAGIQVTLARHV